MNLTPEQRQQVIDVIGTIIALNERSEVIEVREEDWEGLVKEIADAAINAILSLSSPPCAEVGAGASSGVPIPTCKWKDIGEYWLTDCNGGFTFEAGDPKHNGFKFCPYCGKPLEVVE